MADPEGVTGLLDEPFWIVIELQRHAGGGAVEAVEDDHTGLVADGSCLQISEIGNTRLPDPLGSAWLKEG